ncbi:chloramphenicol 3-O phosphotransferase [Arthrobacter sp. CAN_A6]
MSSNRYPRVVVLSGGSISGKSSITRALQEMLPGIWLTFGVDNSIETLPNRGDSPWTGITYEQDGTITSSIEHRTLERSWYTGFCSMARAGAHVILDEVLLSGSAGQKRV